jgi:hypothetical protein
MAKAKKAKAKSPARAKAKPGSGSGSGSGPTAGSQFLGRWDVASVTTLGREDRYAEAGAYIEFEADGLGRFQLGDVEGDVDYREVARDGKPAVEFSWEGGDATDLLSGRGWALFEGDRLAGRMMIHLGEESEFTAIRSAVEPGGSGLDLGPEILPMSPGVRPARKSPRLAAAGTGMVYQLKITLQHIRPPIWRRVVVPDCPLPVLHDVIQIAMGWEDCHLHEFVFGSTRYSDAETAAELETEVADDATLGTLVTKEKTKFLYHYDFGDDWVHEVVVEKIGPPEPGRDYPACVAGKRACPPEDCGGPWGYADFAEAIVDPRHKEHRHWAEWIGAFDPEAFSADDVNAQFRQFF